MREINFRNYFKMLNNPRNTRDSLSGTANRFPGKTIRQNISFKRSLTCGQLLNTINYWVFSIICSRYRCRWGFK
jgi:hypothetical protein